MVFRELKTAKFLKWAGGKGALLPQLEQEFPKEITRYIDPFVGGGAMLFHILINYKPKEAIIIDLNDELMNTYNVVKKDVENLIKELKKHKQQHNKEYYYTIRSQQPEELTRLERAARFIYLNKTCFNGLYRVNKKGEFNVPIGSYTDPKIIDEEKLRYASKLLEHVIIIAGGFEQVLKHAKKGDFIYIDPPYYPLERELKNNKSFTAYTKEVFLEEEQEFLRHVFEELDEKGCLCLQSNSDTKFIKEIYNKYKIVTLQANRFINANAKGRGKISEVVIKNY